ncbi:hypothetical protein P8625_11955 [Tenacibaculum tangerinum]|uniref:Uncharacterized protein n=1 Tax=Tenacibaculum tangerinum TaxID=3038772 RepID=A0ABY8L120_9FLAO|nr:hypothetical protein [Tenacibaculum tangerinum]WGH74791.1 hypothetical protein P8625_11955 [Tenacibaculum tangerinum]
MSYQNARDYSELKAFFELEKKEMEDELTNIIKDYKEADYRKNEYSSQLKDQLGKITSLRDSVTNLKESDYKLIRHYREKIRILVERNKKLFNQINHLNTINNELISKNDSVKQMLATQEKENTKLENINRHLNKKQQALKEKIATAEIIKISPIKFEAMKKEEMERLPPLIERIE